MTGYSNLLTAAEMAAKWKNLKTFKLDIPGAAQAFMLAYGQGDGFHQWDAEADRDPFSYDSQAGVWRQFSCLDGWEKKHTILPQMSDVMAALCAHSAIEKVERETKPDVTSDADKQAVKVDETYRKLRQRHLGSNVSKAVDIAQGLMSVDRWNVDDDRIGLPQCETLRVQSSGPAIDVHVDGQLPTQYITRTLAGKPGAESDLWTSFVLELADGDQEMADALQVWTGAAMLVGNPEHRTHILYGDGATGKSTVLKVVQTAMGDYAGTARVSLFTSERDSHPAELLPFIEKRLIILPELPKGALRSDILKTVTGGDSISVRGMRQNPRTEIPTATLIFSANELPSLRMVDEAIRRRLMVWPFDHKPDKIDVQLGHKLVSARNLPGVLAWLVEGLRQVLKLRGNDQALPIPAKVRKATEDYFDEVDHVGVWRDECVAETGETKSKDLYTNYKVHCEDNNRKPLGERSFYLWMSRHYEKRRGMKGSLYPVTLK